MQLGASIKRRLAEIDDEIRARRAQGYHVDADRLLDERHELIETRDELYRTLMS